MEGFNNNAKSRNTIFAPVAGTLKITYTVLSNWGQKKTI
jgi:hypothetical protein